MQASEIVSGDFDGDGLADLVVGVAEVDESEFFVGDLLYNRSLGGGDFAAPVRLPSASGILAAVRDLEAEDLDGDGNLDLLVGGAFSVSELARGPRVRVHFGDPSLSPPFELVVDSSLVHRLRRRGKLRGARR